MNILDRIKSFFRNSDDELVPSVNIKKEVAETNPIESQLDKPQPKQDFKEKASEFLENTADEIKEQSSAVWEAVKDGFQELEENTREAREKISNKARELGEKVETLIDNTVEKAEALKKEESKIDQDKDNLADSPVTFDPPISEKHEEFFDKASEWLNKKETSDKTVEPQNNKPITPLELPKE